MLLQKRFVDIAVKHRYQIAVYDRVLKKKASYNKLLITSFILAKKWQCIKEERIGVLLPNSIGGVAALLSMAFAEKTPVMINYAMGVDENILNAEKKCGIKYILTSKKLLEKRNIKPRENMIFLEDIIQKISLKEKIIGILKSVTPHKFIPKHSETKEAVILFTTGSEKEPKAVPLTHKNILSNIYGIEDAIKIYSSDRFISVLPIFHVFGITGCVWLPILNGASIITHANPLDYAAIVESIKKFKATLLLGTPNFLAGYVKKSKDGDFSSLRVVVSGADRLSQDLRNEYFNRHKINIQEGYGATETSPVITLSRAHEVKHGSVGRVICNLDLKIVNIDTGVELSKNMEGKVLVKGDSVMSGYLDADKETAKVLKDGWYDTGDIGVIDNDGMLWLKGRHRRFVKVSGEMISLAALEMRIEEILPPETLCCVVEKKTDNGNKNPELIMATTYKDISIDTVNAHLSKYFPRFAMPREIRFFEELPILGSGKVNFKLVEQICSK